MKASSINDLFLATRLLIDNTTRNAEIQKKLTQFGYAMKRVQDGKTLLEKAVMLHDIKTERYDEHSDIAKLVKSEEKAARATFIDHIATVKFAFRHDQETLHKLKLNGISYKLSVWTSQAMLFYKRIEPHMDLLEQDYKLKREEVAQSKAAIEAVIAAWQQRLEKKGQAEEATRVRDEAFKALRAWRTEFQNIAKFALKDTPQLLEALGMLVPSGKKTA